MKITAALGNSAALMRRLLFKKGLRGGIDPDMMFEKLHEALDSGISQASIISFDPEVRPAKRIFADPESQKQHIRSLFPFLPFNEELIEKAGAPPRIEKGYPPLSAAVLTPYLQNPDDTMLMYLILYSMRFHDDFRSHLALCEGWQIEIDGVSFPKEACVRWEVIDFGEGWDPEDGSGKIHKVPHHGNLSPHFGVLAAMWHSPKIIEAMRRMDFPSIYIPSMQVRDACSRNAPKPCILDFCADPCGTASGFDAFGPGGLDRMINSSPRLLCQP